MAKRLTLSALILTSAISMACLEKDITETWYLDAATGSISWSVLEDHVRSDAKVLADKQIEESNYWLDVQRQDHPIARGLRQLGFGDPRTRVLRDTVPYSVLTEAKMGRIDMLGDRLIAHLGMTGTSVLVRTGRTWEWTMTVTEPDTEHGDGPGQDDVNALLDGFDRLTVMLTGGLFEDATGFKLSGDKAAARFQEPTQETSSASGQAHEATGATPMVFRLRWVVR